MSSSVILSNSSTRVSTKDGIDLAVSRFGGCGPPLMVLAATGFSPRMYSELIKTLLPSFTCYGIDLRGHGDSASGPGTDLLHLGTDVATVIRTLDLRGGYAFGHCIGGMAAIWAEILQPGSFCQIITYEPILYHFERTHALGYSHMRWKAPVLLNKVVLKRQRYFESREEVRHRLKGKTPWKRFSAQSLDAYIEHGFKDTPAGVELKCKPENEAASMLWPQRLDPMRLVYPSLYKVHCPVSILAGSDISHTSPIEFIAQYIHEVAKEFPNACFERLTGLHHLGPFEDPKRVAECILAHADLSQAKHRSQACNSLQRKRFATQSQALSRL